MGNIGRPVKRIHLERMPDDIATPEIVPESTRVSIPAGVFCDHPHGDEPHAPHGNCPGLMHPSAPVPAAR